MIAIFKPVKNGPGFDIREFEWNEKGLPGPYKWLKVEDWIEALPDLPIYKPKIACKDLQEYQEQFLDNETLF